MYIYLNRVGKENIYIYITTFMYFNFLLKIPNLYQRSCYNLQFLKSSLKCYSVFSQLCRHDSQLALSEVRIARHLLSTWVAIENRRSLGMLLPVLQGTFSPRMIRLDTAEHGLFTNIEHLFLHVTLMMQLDLTQKKCALQSFLMYVAR